MANLSGIVKQLKRERELVEQQLERLNAALAAFVGVYTKPKRRKMSSASRARIAVAQRARWAKWKARSGLINGSEAVKTEGLVSPYPIYETSSRKK